MAIYMSREGQTGTANSWTRLAGDFAGGTLNDIVVPSGTSSIKQIIWANSTGAVSKYAVYGVKLSGNGLKEGDQETKGFVHVVGSGTVTDGSVIPPMVIDVDIPVTAGNVITVYAAMSGADADCGTPEQAVCLVFS